MRADPSPQVEARGRSGHGKHHGKLDTFVYVIPLSRLRQAAVRSRGHNVGTLLRPRVRFINRATFLVET